MLYHILLLINLYHHVLILNNIITFNLCFIKSLLYPQTKIDLKKNKNKYYAWDLC